MKKKVSMQQKVTVKKKVCVIGAGLSGLTTIKELLEAGHDVECFDQNTHVGGVFSDLGSYDSVLLTVSNYFMAYSDFMPYEDNVRFWTRNEYKNYLERYVDHFGLRSHIRFQCRMEKITELPSGNWQVDFRNVEGSEFSREFERVAICCGQFQKANIPDIPGIENFPGVVMHSSEYKNIQSHPEFHDKRVLCFGMGESAADIVTEIDEVSKNTTLSLRRSHLFSSRMVGKRTIDMVQSRFWHSIPAETKAAAVRNHWRNVLNSQSDDAIKLLAKHNIESSDEPGSVATKTERIFKAQANGMHIDIGGVDHIEGSTVYFSSGHQEDYDCIMFCTGFNTHFPFLPAQYQFSSLRDCFLHCYHPKLRDRLVFIGFARPQQGGVPLIAEMLARYYAQICSGERVLPGNLEGLAKQEALRWKKEFYETPHVAGLVNGFRFNETIADLVGCRPPEPSLWFSPRQYFIYWFHHVQPSQYRLVGPGSRAEARQKWMNAAFSHSDEAIFKRGKIVMILKLLAFRLRSKFAKNEHQHWRPIFEPMRIFEPIDKPSKTAH